MSDRPGSRREAVVRNALESEGWTVTNRGWPDFLCFKNNPDGTFECKFVEVKPEASSLFRGKSYYLSKHQKAVRSVLERFSKYEIARIE